MNFLPLSATRARSGGERIGRRRTEVVCRFFYIPQPAEEGMGLARFVFAAYATVPVYTEFFRALGWAERSTPWWRRGGRGTGRSRWSARPRS